MTGVIKLDFNKGTVKQDVAQLPEKIYVATLDVLKERTDLMVWIAKSLAPKDTWALMKSIRSQWIGKGRRVCIVRAGGYEINPKTKKLVDYAAIVEMRQPYMRPAWEEAKQGIEDMIESRVVSAVEH